MQHRIYIISDTELGRGDIMDDFNDDETLIKFIEQVSLKPSEQNRANVHLVFNGDNFDYLKMAYDGTYPRVITEEISLWKTGEIFRSHSHVFNTLEKFLENPSHHLTFVIGNHDPDLAWPSVQQAFRDKLHNHHRLHFAFSFDYKDIHAEHGNLLDTFFYFNVKKPIITYRRKRILNLPWGSRIVFSHLIKIKENFPNEEKIQPITSYIKHHPELKKFFRKTMADLILKKFFIHPTLLFFDPTYRAPQFKILKEIFKKKFKTVSFDQFSKTEFNKLIRQNPDAKIICLGHSHKLAEVNYKNRLFMITDTWRNEIEFNTMKKKDKSFAAIIYNEENLVSAGLKKFK